MDRKDVFISHHHQDSNVAEIILNKLESDYKFQCIYADRDFHGGVSIVSNIVGGIERCRRTLLVFSENFMKSNWAQMEVELAVHKSVTKKVGFQTRPTFFCHRRGGCHQFLLEGDIKLRLVCPFVLACMHPSGVISQKCMDQFFISLGTDYGCFMLVKQILALCQNMLITCNMDFFIRL